jgi:muramidase (phage lysozyme)
MDKSIPPPAAAILNLIRATETGRRDASAYDTIYRHKETELTKPITKMRIDELLRNMDGFVEAWDGSASGGYQIIKKTMLDLSRRLGLKAEQIFDPDLQDRLGYDLLKLRGYVSWVEGRSSSDTFMVGLAKEWASFPVPFDMQGQQRRVVRGQSYYAGDGKNKALIDPATVWLALEAARKLTVTPEPDPEPEPKPEDVEEKTLSDAEWVLALETLGRALLDPAKQLAIMTILKGL